MRNLKKKLTNERRLSKIQRRFGESLREKRYELKFGALFRKNNLSIVFVKMEEFGSHQS